MNSILNEMGKGKRNENICILVSNLGFGGAEKVASLQSQIFDSLGFNVFVIAVSNFDGEPYQFAGEIVLLENEGLKIRSFSLLKKFLNENCIDLIVDHRSRMSLPKEIVMKLVLRKYKIVFMIHTIGTIHESNFASPFVKSKWLFNYLHKRASAIVCVSEGIKNKIKRIHNFNQVKTIYNSVDTQGFSNEEASESNVNYILFFGRLEESSKNLTFLIEAYRNSILPSKGINLLILGDGPDKSKYLKLVSDLGLEKNILFMDRVVDPSSIIKMSKYTVLTSHYEGFPMTIVESLACNVPVVVVDCETGPREIVKNGYNGLLVEKNLENFTDALNRMLVDTKLYDFCKSNCKKSIEHLSNSMIKYEWESLINRILTE
jgi:glycosyltransferase involved in cell wall biosynthesis